MAHRRIRPIVTLAAVLTVALFALTSCGNKEDDEAWQFWYYSGHFGGQFAKSSGMSEKEFAEFDTGDMTPEMLKKARKDLAESGMRFDERAFREGLEDGYHGRPSKVTEEQYNAALEQLLKKAEDRDEPDNDKNEDRVSVKTGSIEQLLQSFQVLADKKDYEAMASLVYPSNIEESDLRESALRTFKRGTEYGDFGYHPKGWQMILRQHLGDFQKMTSSEIGKWAGRDTSPDRGLRKLAEKESRFRMLREGDFFMIVVETKEGWRFLFWEL